MAFCQKCGAQIEDGTSVCPACANVKNTAPQQHAATAQNDAETNKGMAILAYILFFIPLLTGAHKTSPFVKYHTNQGTILFIFAVAFGIVMNIILAILRAILWNGFTWGIYGLLSTVLNILWLAPTALLIIGIINAVQGKTKTLPVIGDKFTIIK